MLQFLETGKAVYVLAAACILGIISKLITRSLYKRLIKQTDNMATTKNKFLKNFKQKAENTYWINHGIYNTSAYIERQLYDYHFGGLSLNDWNSVSGQMGLLCVLTGGLGAFMAYWYRIDSYYIILYGSMGALLALTMLWVDNGMRILDKRERLLIHLQDYVDNNLGRRAVKEARDNREKTEDSEVSSDSGAAAAREPATRRSTKRRFGKTVADVQQEEPATEEAETGTESGVSRRRGNLRAVPMEDPEETGKTAGSRAAARSSRNAEREDVSESRRKAAAPAAVARSGTREEAGQEDNENVEYLKKSLDQIAASREKERAEQDTMKELNPEEVRLLGEIIRKYLE